MTRLTAAGAQSADGKASYVMLNLAGEQGQTLANEGVQAVRKVIEDTKAPPGVQAYVAGPAALTDDLHVIGNASLAQITLITLVAIAGMLLVVYRSIITTLIQLFLTVIGLLTARGVVSVLAMPRRVRADDVRREHPDDAGDRGCHRLRHLHLRPLSRGARRPAWIGMTAYYTTFRSVAPVIVGFGPDDRRGHVLPQFRAAALLQHDGRTGRDRNDRGRGVAVTLGPAVLFLGSRVGLFESKRGPEEPVLATRRYRRCPLARTDFRGELVHRADRHRRAFRDTSRPTTIATTCRTTPRSISASPPPTGTSPKPG